MNRWIVTPKPRPRCRVRLFCFPYAGGAASSFLSWPDKLPAAVEVCAIQLPGRATRFEEAPFVRMPALVSALEDALLPALDRPFAFFGHSLGATVSFELARRLRTRHAIEPLHLFVSGAAAPHLEMRAPPLHASGEAQLLKALARLNGTPSEVLESQELMQLVAPAVRADFAVCETYTYKRGAKLTCPITAFGGRGDRKIKRRDLDAWAIETKGALVSHSLPGGHFFLRSDEDQLLALLSAELERLIEIARKSGPVW